MRRVIEEACPGATVEFLVPRQGPPVAPTWVPLNTGTLGVLIFDRGWTTIPQERDESRRPALDCGRWAIKPSIHKAARPPRADVERWFQTNPHKNIALLVPEARDAIRVLDFDITDPDLARAAHALAIARLGRTFHRVGRPPRFALIYRSDPLDPIVRGRSLDLVTPDGQHTPHAVEVLGPGRMLTAYGYHHETCELFRWGALQPTSHGPEHAPVVGARKLQMFLEEFDRTLSPLRGLRQGTVVSHGEVEASAIHASGAVVPGGARLTPEVVFDAAGRVVDRRETYVTKRALRYVSANRALAGSGEGRYRLAGLLRDECGRIFAPGGSAFRSSEDLVRACRERIDSAWQGLTDGRIPSRPVAHDESGVTSSVYRSPIAIQGRPDDDLSWLSPPAKRKAVEYGARTAPDPVAARSRDLRRDRRREAQAVSDAVRRGIDAFLDEAWVPRPKDGPPPPPPIRILRAPTGGGKTTTLIERVAAKLRTDGRPGHAVALLLPSYSNLDEAMTRAKGGAAAMTEFFRHEAGVAVRDAQARGLTVMLYTGKSRGGCRMLEKLQLLQAAQIGSYGLCEGHVDDGYSDEKVHVTCEHYDTCSIIEQRKAVARADLVLMPMSFLTLPLPKQVREAIGAVVVDERCWPEIARTAEMPLAVLDKLRKATRRLTKDELAEGWTPEGLQAARHTAVSLFKRAVDQGVDPATLIARYDDRGTPGRVFVQAAKKVCSRARDAAVSITPRTTMAEIAALAAAPQGERLLDEWRLWDIVDDRLQAIEDGTATGDRDRRLQILDGDTVRMSWLRTSNFLDVPMMLLDASADEEIVRRCFHPRPVVLADVPGSLHVRIVAALDRTYSNTSFQPAAAEDPMGAVRRADQIVKTQRAISTVAAMYGHGRVLVGSSMSPRRILQTSGTWVEPPNVDFGHYGAFRGLDFAKSHVAAVAVGRMELSARTVDGLVAALTYRDEDMEAPIDALGTGLTERGKSLATMGDQIVRLRDGSDLPIRVPRWEGEMARRVQRQYREEELRQFLGRLRPVHRDGEPPVLVVLGRVLPDDWIVDEIVDLDSLAAPDGYDVLGEVLNRAGVADSELAGEAALDLMSRSSVDALVQRAGLSGGDLSSRPAKGMVAVKVAVPGERDRVVQVPGYHPDPVGHVVRLHSEQGVPCVASIVGLGTDHIPSGRKGPDRIDAEIGTRDERLARDRRLRVEIGRPAYAEAEAAEGGHFPGIAYAGRAGILATKAVPLDVRIALEVLAPDVVRPPPPPPRPPPPRSAIGLPVTPSDDPWLNPFDDVVELAPHGATSGCPPS